LGGVRDIEVDVRVIAASNSPLAEAVRSGKFRNDLFHRLSVIPITIPPLRERLADVVPLATHFLRQHAKKHKSMVTGISPKACELLMTHRWPGNVREVRNVIEHAVLIEQTVQIQPESISFTSLASGIANLQAATEAPGPSPAGMSLKDSERQLVMRALERAGGNQTKAAKLLGITRDMLRHRVKKMALKVEDF
jgi:transcriptional regulator with PAS, ATPase and Fis domain